MYLDGPIKKYLDDLAARKPAPGGGSAAALCAAIGAGLLVMAGNYSIKTRDCKGSFDSIAANLARAEKARGELEKLIDLDVAAYGGLCEGLKTGKDDSPAVQDLYKKAADVPFEICKLSADCLKLCSDLADCQNKNLMSDTASAAVMLEAAFFSARFNVYVNLKHIKDMKYIEKVHAALGPLEEKVPPLKEEVLEKCGG